MKHFFLIWPLLVLTFFFAPVSASIVHSFKLSTPAMEPVGGIRYSDSLVTALTQANDCTVFSIWVWPEEVNADWLSLHQEKGKKLSLTSGQSLIGILLHPAFQLEGFFSGVGNYDHVISFRSQEKTGFIISQNGFICISWDGRMERNALNPRGSKALKKWFDQGS